MTDRSNRWDKEEREREDPLVMVDYIEQSLMKRGFTKEEINHMTLDEASWIAIHDIWKREE